MSNCLPPHLNYVDLSAVDVCSPSAEPDTLGQPQGWPEPELEPQSGGHCDLPEDVDGDGIVSVYDLLRLLSMYNVRCP